MSSAITKSCSFGYIFVTLLKSINTHFNIIFKHLEIKTLHVFPALGPHVVVNHMDSMQAENVIIHRSLCFSLLLYNKIRYSTIRSQDGRKKNSENFHSLNKFFFLITNHFPTKRSLKSAQQSITIFNCNNSSIRDMYLSIRINKKQHVQNDDRWMGQT